MLGATLVYNSRLSASCIYFFDSTACVAFVVQQSFVQNIKYYADIRTLFISFFSGTRFFPAGAATLLKIVRIFHTLFVLRLRVIGRLYRIYKRNIYGDMMYRFGNSHKITVYTAGVYIKFIRKKRIRLIGFDYLFLSKKAREARAVFPQNIYTNRGIRVGTDRFYAKMGKILKFY